MSEKEKFLYNCSIFRQELKDLQNEIDFEEREKTHGTLAYIGANYSYRLANICFGLGYATWFFVIGEPNGKKLNYEELKQGVCDTIISNEKIGNLFDTEEIEMIKNKILNTKIS